MIQRYLTGLITWATGTIGLVGAGSKILQKPT